MFLADSYINYHITNSTMVSKGLHILDILAEKKTMSIKLSNPYLSKFNPSIITPISLSQIYMLPRSPMCHFVKAKLRVVSYGIEDEFKRLGTLVKKYYDLTSLEKIIIKKLAFLAN